MRADSFSTLIDAVALRARLPAADWRVVDCRATLGQPEAGRERYRAGHIPDAVHAHLECDLSGPVGAATGRHPLPDPQVFAARCATWGIGPDTQVVAYDDAGGVYAARLWWLLRWIGHQRVAVLDGGWQAWCTAGGTAAGGDEVAQATETDVWLDDRCWLSVAELAAELASTEPPRLVDVRSPERFRGDVEPIDPVAGHIPGAVNLPFAGNLDGEGRFLPAQVLAQRYRQVLAGESPDRLVCYCGSGVTACHSLLALAHAGMQGARLYAGSWSEWIRDPRRPVARD